MHVKSSLAGASLLILALAGCAVGPNYKLPTTVQATAFKENKDWTPAQPADHIDRGAWWSVYADPALDALIRKVELSNQNLAAAEASYRQARALTAESRASFFPTISASGGATRSGGRGQTSGFGSTTGTAGSTVTSRDQTRYTASLGASWAPDIWGRIRRTVEGDKANAQASAADLASAKLSYQAELASNYFTLRALDEQARLYALNIEGYRRSVELTNNQYQAGVAARADVITAETQLKNAQAQAADLGVQRAQVEHAMAVLIGLPPSNFELPRADGLASAVPVAPAGLPSELLQRRPDIASAERSVADANAQIGVATAAYFPTLTLSGSEGFASTALDSLFKAGSNVWSFGPSLAETVFDFGGRKARVAQARANYDRQVALYRQTVLEAFQGVEDQLAALRVLEGEATLRNDAAASAKQAEQLALNRYRAGQVDFTTVVQAQTTATAAEQSALSVQRQRLLASVSLIEALGGGWSVADLPKG
jgi:NodT family efflux transporter outer membrane factor (OMF) lipoprotein